MAPKKKNRFANETKVIQHDRQLVCCRYSSDLRFLYAAGFDGRLHRWELASDKHDSFAAPGGWIESMVLHPEKPQLFTADSWGTIRGWNLEDKRAAIRWTVKKAHSTWLRRMTISGDGKWLATGGNDQLVRVFSTDGKPKHALRSHKSHVQSVAFHPDGAHLVSGDLRGTIHQWSVASGKQIRSFSAANLYKNLRQYDQGGARVLTFDKSGSTLFCGGFEGVNPNQADGKPTVVAIDWKTGKTRLLTSKAPFKGPILDLAWHPAGYLIGAGSSEGGGRLWFWKDGESEEKLLVKNPTSFRSLHLHTNGKNLAATAFGDRGGQRGGNGRRLNKKGEYVGFAGNIVLYELAVS